jgi:hypothetical protein
VTKPLQIWTLGASDELDVALSPLSPDCSLLVEELVSWLRTEHCDREFSARAPPDGAGRRRDRGELGVLVTEDRRLVQAVNGVQA